MTKIKISQLIWDRVNIEHIKTHNVTRAEVEKAVTNAQTHIMVKQGRILLIGRVGKRILSVILGQEAKNSYYVVTARDAAKKERRRLYGKEKE